MQTSRSWTKSGCRELEEIQNSTPQGMSFFLISSYNIEKGSYMASELISSIFDDFAIPFSVIIKIIFPSSRNSSLHTRFNFYTEKYMSSQRLSCVIDPYVTKERKWEIIANRTQQCVLWHGVFLMITWTVNLLWHFSWCSREKNLNQHSHDRGYLFLFATIFDTGKKLIRHCLAFTFVILQRYGFTVPLKL